MGTHGKANGLKSVVEAAKELKERQNNKIKIVLIGDGSEKKDLGKYKTQNNLDNLIFIPPLPKVHLSGWMNRSNIGLQVLSNIPEFYYGTSPNKFFDYLSVGLPVLVNYPGWLATIVEDNKIGYFANPSIYNSLADKLEEAYENRGNLEIGQSSLELARNKFDRKILFTHFHDFLRTVHKNENYANIRYIHFFSRNYHSVTFIDIGNFSRFCY